MMEEIKSYNLGISWSDNPPKMCMILQEVGQFPDLVTSAVPEAYAWLFGPFPEGYQRGFDSFLERADLKILRI